MIELRELTKCEWDYVRCFSSCAKEPDAVRFRDPLLPEMYDHNYTHLGTGASGGALSERIRREIGICRSQGMGFCHIMLDGAVDSSQFSQIPILAKETRYGYYTRSLAGWGNPKPGGAVDCSVKKAEGAEAAGEILLLELEQDGVAPGNAFYSKRAARRALAYLSEGGVDSFLCYSGIQAVGRCDLFINDALAKIEDFMVLPDRQRRGYGTALLNSVMEAAAAGGAREAYLVTDEDDTPKEMYLKYGFRKAGEKTGLLFML